MHNVLDELDLHHRGASDPEAMDDMRDAAAHVKLGSEQRSCFFADVEQLHKADRAFIDFRIKLNNFLNVFLPANGIPLPDRRRVQLRTGDQVY